MKYRVGDILKGKYDRRTYTVTQIVGNRVFVSLEGGDTFDYYEETLLDGWIFVSHAPDNRPKGFAKFIRSIEGKVV